MASKNRILRDKLLMNMCKPTCVYCERALTTYNITLEHILPKKHGGTNHVSNLELCCIVCNTEKRELLLTQYIKAFDVIITKRIAQYL